MSLFTGESTDWFFLGFGYEIAIEVFDHIVTKKPKEEGARG